MWWGEGWVGREYYVPGILATVKQKAKYTQACPSPFLVCTNITFYDCARVWAIKTALLAGQPWLSREIPPYCPPPTCLDRCLQVRETMPIPGLTVYALFGPRQASHMHCDLLALYCLHLYVCVSVCMWVWECVCLCGRVYIMCLFNLPSAYYCKPFSRSFTNRSLKGLPWLYLRTCLF